MARKRSAQHKSKLPSIIIGFFLIFSTIIFLLLAISMVFEPDLNHKNIVFVPKKIGGGEGKILFAEIFPEKNALYVMELDGRMESEVVGGYGKYKLESVLQLLKQEKKDKIFINSAFSNFLKKGVDEIVEYNDAQKVDNKASLLKLFLKNRVTFPYAFFVKDLKSDQLVFDQTESLENWQKKLTQQTSSKINENCTVAIVNTTARAGLAGDLAMILENSGVEVVRVTNNSWGNAQTNLYLNDLNSCSLVKNRVQSFSPVDLEVVVDTNKTSQYRASLVLFIGDEVAQFFED